MQWYLLLLVAFFIAEIRSKVVRTHDKEVHLLGKRHITGTDLDQKKFQQSMHEIHNSHRAKHCAPSLKHDPNLSADALEWAKHLATVKKMEHANFDDVDVGENIYTNTSSGPITNADAAAATNMWYAENGKYNYNSAKPVSGTGHFSQVVWQGTTAAGYGYAITDDARQIFIVARYSPAGNYQNEYGGNVVPAGSKCKT